MTGFVLLVSSDVTWHIPCRIGKQVRVVKSDVVDGRDRTDSGITITLQEAWPQHSNISCNQNLIME
jgi:hypothetical protein